MTTVTAGSTTTYTFSDNEQATLSITTGNQARVTVKDASTGAQKYGATTWVSQTVGPFKANDTLSVTAIRGAVDFTISTYSPPSTGVGTITSVAGHPGPTVTLTSGDLSDVAQLLRQALTWDPVGNIPALSAGSVTGNGIYFSSAVVPVAITVPIATTMYPNDWLIWNASLTSYVQYSYQQLVALCPDVNSYDFTQNASIGALSAQVSANALTLAGLKLNATSTTFSTIWDTSGSKDMGDFTVVGPLALTSNVTGSVVGGFTQGTIIADGTNTPTFDGATLAAYVTTAGSRNRVKVERVGNSIYWSSGTPVGAAMTKGAQSAPTLTGTPAIKASWDFGDTSKLTISSGTAAAGGLISSVAGADGTAFSIANATGGTQPTSVTHNSQIKAKFTGGQFLQIVNALGLSGATTGCTVLVVYEPITTTATQAMIDIAAAGRPFSQSRIIMLASNTTGYGFRRNDVSSVSSSASVGSAYTSGIRLLIGRMAAGASSVASFNLDGAGTALTTATASASPSLDTTTIGGSTEANVQAKPMDGYLTRIIIWPLPLSDAQAEQAAVWAASVYGTTNAA